MARPKKTFLDHVATAVENTHLAPGEHLVLPPFTIDHVIAGCADVYSASGEYLGESVASHIGTIADTTPFVGAVAQLTAAARAAVKLRNHAEHARLEQALFALYTLQSRLADVELDGAVGEIKALL